MRGPALAKNSTAPRAYTNRPAVISPGDHFSPSRRSSERIPSAPVSFTSVSTRAIRSRAPAGQLLFGAGMPAHLAAPARGGRACGGGRGFRRTAGRRRPSCRDQVGSSLSRCGKRSQSQGGGAGSPCVVNEKASSCFALGRAAHAKTPLSRSIEQAPSVHVGSCF